ncbi:hypothetical protein GINT2_001193 [Glugoides intestinalis]
MNKDFKINALRTRMKYKLTALRVGMKGHILEELKAAFGSELLELPMALILEAVEKEEEGISIEKPIDNVVEKALDNVVEKPVDNVVEKPIDNVVEKPVDNVVEKPVDNTFSGKIKLTKKRQTILADKKEAETTSTKAKSDEYKTFTVPVLKRLPGLRRYGNNDESSILTEDSIFERRIRKKSKERANIKGK